MLVAIELSFEHVVLEEDCDAIGRVLQRRPSPLNNVGQGHCSASDQVSTDRVEDVLAELRFQNILAQE